MLTFPFPTTGTFQYPKKNFASLGNLRRVTDNNRRAFRQYVDRTPFNLENEHLLVGILQQLSIDPEWDLDYVVSYSRFRSYTLCTQFNITSIQGIGKVITDGFYRQGVQELWGLIENDRTYSEVSLNQEALRPVIPIFSNLLTRGYKLTAERPVSPKAQGDKLAIIGLDIVELAVGWWLYMRSNPTRDTGIHAYLCKHPLYTAQLIHNQSVVINMFYEFFVTGKDFNSLFSVEPVDFITMSEEKLLKEWFTFKAGVVTDRKLVNIGHLMDNLDSLYSYPYFNYESGGNNKLFTQTSWLWEPAAMKWYAVYLTIAERMGYQTGDVATMIARVLPAVTARFDKCPSTFCGDHFKGIAQQLVLLLKKNIK